jgi:hypothetical protein
MIQAGRLLPADVPVIAAPAGSAPRRFAFHPSGRFFYNLYEHDAQVAVYDYDAVKGGLKFKQSVSALPPKFSGSNLSSEIRVAADGRFLYVANRLHNAVAVFAVATDGQLRMISEVWARADNPRCLAIDPRGQFLYSCNQRGDSITSFRINTATGGLQFTGRFEPVGSPTDHAVPRRGSGSILKPHAIARTWLNVMQIAMIGLGRMGANMAQRLMRGGHKVVGFDPADAARTALEQKGAQSAATLEQLVASCRRRASYG